jgi:hypothetical protein
MRGEFNMKAPAAATLVVAGLSMMAQAAEPATLTLACQGTKTVADATQPDIKDPPPPAEHHIAQFDLIDPEVRRSFFTFVSKDGEHHDFRRD